MSASPSATAPTPAPALTGPAADPLWRLEALVLAGLLILLVAVRVHAVTHAGGLWRDEIHSLELAKAWSEPPWIETFPALWIYSVRGWLLLVRDSSDVTCRLFGFLLGLTLVPAAWWATRFRGATGWMTLVLVGLHPIAVVYGGQFRGYGLGLTLQLLLFGVMTRIVFGPESRRHWIALLVVSLLAVQSSYTNCFMLLAISAGGGVVCLLHRRWRAILAIGLNGLLAALSMMPYVLYAFPKISDAMIISRGEYSLAWYIGQCLMTLEAMGTFGLLVWIILPGALVAAGLWRFRRLPDESAFALTTLLVGTAAFFFYLKYLRVPTQTWYYLPVMVLWAFCADVLLAALLPQSGSIRAVRSAVVVALVLVLVPAVWTNSAVRLTNVDLAAKELTSLAAPEDLIVVHPWYAGITFSRYYSGKADWTTYPDVLREPWTGHRNFKHRMMQPRPVEADLKRIETALKSGRRLWLVGQLQFLQQGEAPGDLPPAPHSPYRWSEGAYGTIWSRQAAAVVQRYGTRIELVPTDIPDQVQNVELFPVFEITGWHKAEASP